MKKSVVFLFVCMMILLAACNQAAEDIKDSGNDQMNGTQTVTDGSGTEITLEKTPERIGCLTEICVDTLHQLGLEPAAVSAGGITAEPELYGEASSAFNVIGGSFFEPNLEDIYESELDLVVGLGGVHEGIREGLAGSVPLYIASPTTYEESLDFVREFGRILGKEKEAKEITEEFEAKLESYKMASSGEKKALIMYGSDVNFGVETTESVVGSLLAELADYPWDAKGSGEGAQYSLEEVLKQDPEVIFVETFSFGEENTPLSEQLAENPIWKELEAVENQDVHEVRTNIWASGRGVGSLTIVLEEAMGLLYPETLEE